MSQDRLRILSRQIQVVMGASAIAKARSDGADCREPLQVFLDLIIAEYDAEADQTPGAERWSITRAIPEHDQ